MALPSTRSWAEPHRRAKVQREHALGMPSARSYLLTILGEFVLGQPEPTWTTTFLKSLAVLGIDEKTARQTLARSSARGLLTAERVGRRTRWHLTDRARQLLSEGTHRIYSFHTQKRLWDHRWVVILITIPESRRDARYSLRVRLSWAGFAPLSSGAWVCPWVEQRAEAEQVLEELSLIEVAHTFIGELGDKDSPACIAAEAWDLVAVKGVYEQFLRTQRCRVPKTPQDAFYHLTKLVNEWRRLPLLDPDLPSELLPPEWSGDKAAKLFHELHDAWKPEALKWWLEIAHTR